MSSFCSCASTLFSHFFIAGLYLSWVLLCSLPLPVVSLCGSVVRTVVWGVGIWVLPGQQQPVWRAHHWQATWLMMPFGCLTSYNVCFSLLSQLVLTWSSLLLGDSKLPGVFLLLFPKMVMKSHNHNTSLILLENVKYCMVEEAATL